MDIWISTSIENELQVAREKRHRYNTSRKEMRENECNLDGFQLLHNNDQTVNETSYALNENESMEVEEAAHQSQHLSSSSTSLNCFAMNNRSTCAESASDDDETDDDFEIINAYESFLNSDQSDSNSDEEQESDHDKTLVDRLHTYTNVTTSDACIKLMHLLRSSQISKSQSQQLLSFIHGLLPTPNNFPSSISKLLSEINVQTYYQKRIICSLCGAELDKKKKCLSCHNFEKKHLVFIYDTQFTTILTLIISRLFQEIENYREKFSKDKNNIINETYDIPFANIYQYLRKSYDNKMITLLFHLDGIGICKSTKLKMWILTASIIELPPRLRYRRENMPLISLWFSCATPNIDMWLSHSIDMLKLLKLNGISIGKNAPNLHVLYYGVIGDCPALSLITKFTNHGGYHCCFYCYLKGTHNRICKKRQYPLSLPLKIRDPQAFAIQAKRAADTGEKLYGHKGQSKLSEILDVPLPIGIICDYQHVTLLRHFRDVVKIISASLPIVIRKDVDYNLRNQSFPHFFNRKMRGIDEFSYIKASELRNLLLYGFVPNFYDVLTANQTAHMCLFICGIRMLHCSNENFDKPTSYLAGELLKTYYQYHPQFYQYLENFVLHLHIHYAANYDRHGALSCVNTFAQESLIGYIASNRNGTRDLSDLIMYYYNIDTCLSNKTSHSLLICSSGPLDAVSNAVNYYSNEILVKHHTMCCDCHKPIEKCVHFYQRYNIHGRIFHSMAYRKKGLSNSYTIQYLNSNTSNNGKCFGEIMIFFSNHIDSYAVVKILASQQLLSDHLKSSQFYRKIRQPLDAFYHVVTRQREDQFVCVPVTNILKHCIVFVKDPSKSIITPISSYEEHD